MTMFQIIARRGDPLGDRFFALFTGYDYFSFPFPSFNRESTIEHPEEMKSLLIVRRKRIREFQ